MRGLFEPEPNTVMIGNDTCPCGETQFTVEPGKGPHAAALRCSECQRFFRWMSHPEYLLYRGYPNE